MSWPCPLPEGQSRPTAAKAFTAARKALGPVGAQGVIAWPLSPPQLPALHPTSHGVGEGDTEQQRWEERGVQGTQALQAGPQGAARGAVSLSATWREHKVDKEMGSISRRHCWGGGQPGVLQAGFLDSRLFVPGNFKRDLGFGDQETWAEVRRVEASAWSVRGQGEPHLRSPCHAWPRAGTPCILSCSILIHELREIPRSIHPRYAHLLSSCSVSGCVLGTGQ